MKNYGFWNFALLKTTFRQALAEKTNLFSLPEYKKEKVVWPHETSVSFVHV